ncbi:hypothetical protein BV22DRAFT_1000896 [Leucogyrophana mollusca]|uniref:Uncharacterized protein n=1 Tax=Leucogyrophana mollusca TaxID=85980 RepID=A0ACB8BWF8_9AGAM|nr:hypothetical protein BV22DRAFT_1000896 [Leucogyrophana mollusca]
MAAAYPPNSRASLLNGLRTGGVRSVSMNMSVPHTAAPGGSFNVPRFASNSTQYCTSPVEEDMDEVGELFSQNLYINNRAPTHPMTAAVDGPNHRFMQQQQQQMGGSRPLNPNSVPFNPSYSAGVQAPAPVDPQTYLQMMQMEMLRLQSAQAQRSQQVQAAVLAEALRKQVSQSRRASLNPPATAGPLNTTFDMRSAANNVPARRPSQAELLKAQLGVSNSPPLEEQVPMTAALGGRFGSRPVASVAFPRSREDVPDSPPQSYSPPGQTTVISGGTSLGSLSSNSASATGTNAPSKSDSAVSWRRGGANNSVLSGLRAVSTSVSPSVKITPPPGERLSPPPSLATNKARPRPLSFSAAPAHGSVPVIIAVDSPAESEYDDAYSSASSQSNPTTPHSSSSLDTPLSPREEATKKLYEGLGMGRPATHAIVLPAIVNPRLAQPMRQPRGPPSGADELGPKNFATRIRRKAIGGLGVLMGARERRETLEAY